MRAFQLVKKQVFVPNQVKPVFFVTRRNGRVCPGAVQRPRFQRVLADEGEARGGGEEVVRGETGSRHGVRGGVAVMGQGSGDPFD